MAIVREKNGVLYIQWYDAQTKKVKSKSSGYSSTQKNRKIVEKIAKELQGELTKLNKDSKKIGVRCSTIQDAFDHFLRNNSGKHKKTIYQYHKFYEKFSESFNTGQPCTIITKLKAEDFLNRIKQLNYSMNTIHIYGKQLVHFLNFLFEYEYCPYIKINRDVMTKAEVKEIVAFSLEGFKKIFSNLDGHNDNFQTLIHLLAYTGLRSSDLLNLTVDNINLEEMSMTYYSPKSKTYRIVPIHSSLKNVLQRRIETIKEGRILQYGETEAIGKAVSRYFDELCLDSRFTARTFRKTFITLCRSKFNIDASIISALVGHGAKSIADKYYNQIGMDKLHEEIEKFKPI